MNFAVWVGGTAEEAAGGAAPSSQSIEPEPKLNIENWRNSIILRLLRYRIKIILP